MMKLNVAITRKSLFRGRKTASSGRSEDSRGPPELQAATEEESSRDDEELNQTTSTTTTTTTTHPQHRRVKFDETRNTYWESTVPKNELREHWHSSQQIKVAKMETIARAWELGALEERHFGGQQYDFYDVVAGAFEACQDGRPEEVDMAVLRSVLSPERMGLERHMIQTISDGVLDSRDELLDATIYNSVPVRIMMGGRERPCEGVAAGAELREACEKASRPCRDFARLMALAYLDL